MTRTLTQPKFASALSDAEAADQAAEQAAQGLGRRLEGPVDLLILLVSAAHRDVLDKIAQRLARQFSPRLLLAATAEGVVGVGRELEDGPGLAALAATLPGTTLQPFCYSDLTRSQELAEADLRDELNPPADTRAMVLLGDPFSVPMANLLPALGAALPGVPIVGGMAGAGRQPGSNRFILNDRLMREGAVGVIIGGELDVRTTVSQGCRAIGKPFVITKAQRHIVQELAGRPALEIVREVAQNLSEEDRQHLGQSPLMVGRVINEYKDRFGRGDFLIRNIVGIDKDKQYLAISDPLIRVGQTIQFHLRDRRTAREDFEMLLEAERVHGPAQGALLFTCNGRGTRLFDEPHTDAKLVQAALGDAPLAGMFAAGEIGPVGEQTFLHGHTASLIVFRQREPAPAEVEA